MSHRKNRKTRGAGGVGRSSSAPLSRQETGGVSSETSASRPEVDYDDSCPFSCIAAAARESGHPKPIAADGKQHWLKHWWKVWNQAHDPRFPDLDTAVRAAEHLRALGDSEAYDREMAFRRKNAKKKGSK